MFFVRLHENQSVLKHIKKRISSDLLFLLYLTVEFVGVKVVCIKSRGIAADTRGEA